MSERCPKVMCRSSTLEKKNGHKSMRHKAKKLLLKQSENKVKEGLLS